MKIAKFLFAAVLAAVLVAASCSSSDSDDGSDGGDSSTTTSQSVAAAASAVPATAASSALPETSDEVSVVVPFTSDNGSGYVTASGDGSPVTKWFANQPGEVSLDLVDADVTDPVSVVEEMISFWFFQDDDSGEMPPNIYVSAGGDISDSVGSRYVVEAQGLPPAPVAETTTTTSSTTSSTTTASTTSAAPTEEPATSEPSTTTTTSAATSAAPVTTTTTTVVESPVSLQVQVLNGSGVAGAAGRMTDKLSEAGYVVLPASNAPERYRSSAVYYQEGWRDRAEEILQAAEIDEVEEPVAMPQQFASEDAAVVVLLGTDTAPAVIRERADLRPEPNFDVKLPLGSEVPRDRFVPGLADIQIYTRQNDEDETTFNYINSLQQWLGYVGNFQENGNFGVASWDRGSYRDLLTVYESIEEVFDWLGFTPQNVCGAPAGYSFTDLLQPTREFSEETQSHRGNAIFTTDRLLELHGGTRINPEANLEFYIQQAVQTAYDSLRLAELSDEIEAPQMILCDAWKLPAGEIPEAANGYWYALLTPGIQPSESLLSQGTYHVKEISRNGNIAYVLVCHPTLGEQNILLHWRESGYRAEAVGSRRNFGCQQSFERETYIWEDTNGTEDTYFYAFGESVFSGADMDSFPRG